MNTYYEGCNGRLIPVTFIEEKGRDVVVSVQKTIHGYTAGEVITIPKYFFVEKIAYDMVKPVFIQEIKTL